MEGRKTFTARFSLLKALSASTLLPALKLNSPPALPLAPQPQPDDFDYSAKPPAAAEFENVTLWEAWAIPGVASFALCLFFSKLIAYTFL